MDRVTLERHLALADAHVAEGHRLVENQRELIKRLDQDGHDTFTARTLLATFEEVQQMHIADRDRLSKELEVHVDNWIGDTQAGTAGGAGNRQPG